MSSNPSSSTSAEKMVPAAAAIKVQELMLYFAKLNYVRQSGRLHGAKIHCQFLSVRICLANLSGDCHAITESHFSQLARYLS